MPFSFNHLHFNTPYIIFLCFNSRQVLSTRICLNYKFCSWVRKLASRYYVVCMPGSQEHFALPVRLCYSYYLIRVYHENNTIFFCTHSHSCHCTVLYCTSVQCTVKIYEFLKHNIDEIWMHCDQNGLNICHWNIECWTLFSCTMAPAVLFKSTGSNPSKGVYFFMSSMWWGRRRGGGEIPMKGIKRFSPPKLNLFVPQGTCWANKLISLSCITRSFLTKKDIVWDELNLDGNKFKNVIDKPHKKTVV
jgi:hypothetical protein